jgi:beta-phosphoglucomutase-like phosphatase (HAD superfamily)
MIASRFELVIFDCDRVLLDSEPSINRAHAVVLTACGHPITAEELVQRFCGVTDAEVLDVIEREWGPMSPPSYIERVGAMLELGFCHWLAAIEGVAEVTNCDRELLLPARACRDRCRRTGVR